MERQRQEGRAYPVHGYSHRAQPSVWHTDALQKVHARGLNPAQSSPLTCSTVLVTLAPELHWTELPAPQPLLAFVGAVAQVKPARMPGLSTETDC